MYSGEVSNNYLKNAVEEMSMHLRAGEDVPREVFANLINELSVSNLIVPAISEGDKLNFQILSDEEENLLPLYTDIEFFKSHAGEYEAIANDIGFYMELVREYDLHGVLINPGIDDFLIGRELFLELPLDLETEEIQSENPLPADELLEISKNADNRELEKVLSDGDAGFEELMILLSESTLFSLILSPADLSEIETDGIVKIEDVNEYSHCTTGDENHQYGVLFTNANRIKEVIKGDLGKYYYQIVLLDDYMDFILKNDMAGIIINPGLNDVILPRATLHEARHGLTYNNLEYESAVGYMFKI